MISPSIEQLAVGFVYLWSTPLFLFFALRLVGLYKAWVMFPRWRGPSLFLFL